MYWLWSHSLFTHALKQVVLPAGHQCLYGTLHRSPQHRGPTRADRAFNLPAYMQTHDRICEHSSADAHARTVFALPLLANRSSIASHRPQHARSPQARNIVCSPRAIYRAFCGDTKRPACSRCSNSSLARVTAQITNSYKKKVQAVGALIS